MVRKSTALLALFFLCLFQIHAQTPGTIKVARPKSNTTDTASQRANSNQAARNFPDLQPNGFDLGVVYKSPQHIGLCVGAYGGLFLVGKERNKVIGFSTGADWYLKGTTNYLQSGQFGIWFWTPAARKILFDPKVVYSRVVETDQRYFSIRPEIKYIITRKITAQAGLQFDLKGGSQSATPQIRLALLYRIRMGR